MSTHIALPPLGACREADLLRVSAQHAGTVILLQPDVAQDDAASEALKAATLVALGQVNPCAAVVVQMARQVCDLGVEGWKGGSSGLAWLGRQALDLTCKRW